MTNCSNKNSDIFLPNGKLKPWNFFSYKGLNLNNYFLILGLLKALPGSWRALLNSGTVCCSQIPDSNSTYFTEFKFHSKTGDINLIQLTSEKLYWILVDDIRVHPTAKLKIQLYTTTKILTQYIRLKFLATVKSSHTCLNIQELSSIRE